MGFSTFEFSRHSPEELVRVRDALRSLVGSPGWEVFMRFLRERQNEIGMQALDDDSRSKDYWKGYRDGCRVQDGVTELLAYAEATIEARVLEDGERSLEARADRTLLGQSLGLGMREPDEPEGTL